VLTSKSALAHEYYLLPESFTPAAGASVKVSHKLGEKFFGNENIYSKLFGWYVPQRCASSIRLLHQCGEYGRLGMLKAAEIDIAMDRLR
ncbi:MAG: hypothetical protein AAFZ49_12955, partial [Cyanobacteria bacterium J06659_2]